VRGSNKETTTLRRIEPGHWDVGLSLCSNREFARGAKSVSVCVEVTGLNPKVIILVPATSRSIMSAYHQRRSLRPERGRQDYASPAAT
jgi:hypothetical protein